MKLKDIMKDCLETRGYEPTDTQLDALYEIYEDCQEWDNDKMLTGNSYDEVEDFVRHSSSVDKVLNGCPLGGDTENDCADCVYSCDHHFVDGECVEREEAHKC